jgi:hypothetical protein
LRSCVDDFARKHTRYGVGLQLSWLVLRLRAGQASLTIQGALASCQSHFASSVTWFKPGILGHAQEHSETNLLSVMRSKAEISSSKTRQGSVDS